MPTPDTDHMADAIRSNIHDDVNEEVMVLSFVTVAAYTDSSGGVGYYICTAEDQRRHETMGLLEWARLVQSQSALDGLTPPED